MKNYVGFHIPKMRQNLKHFDRSFYPAWTSYFCRVLIQVNLCIVIVCTKCFMTTTPDWCENSNFVLFSWSRNKIEICRKRSKWVSKIFLKLSIHMRKWIPLPAFLFDLNKRPASWLYIFIMISFRTLAMIFFHISLYENVWAKLISYINNVLPRYICYNFFPTHFFLD